MVAGLLVLNLGNTWAYANSVSAVLYHYVLPAAVTLGLLAGLRLSWAKRLVLAICLAAVMPALYATEGYLWYRYLHRLEGSSTNFDRRTKLQVIADLRREGNLAFPDMRAKAMLIAADDGTLVSALSDDKRRILPLANVPRRTIVACNETGQWMIFESDEFGFNNPPGRWTPAPGKVALVGDSFTKGDCLARDHNIAARLGERFFDVVNLGTSGFGPLSELASIKEYLAEIHPNTVLWLFFEGNDVTGDMTTERRSATLLAYLRPGFRQGLMADVDSITPLFEGYLDAEMEEAIARVSHPFQKVRDFFQLWRVREIFGLDTIGLGIIGDDIEGNLAIFSDVLKEAKRIVESWDGRLVFVYLPDGPRYFASASSSRIRNHIRTYVLAIAEATALPVIDVHKAFAAHADPKTLFAYPGSHYNADGYALAADAVTAGLQSLARSSACAAPRTCWEGSHDGWDPLYGKSLLNHLKRQGLPVPERNTKGRLPRE